ncbi:MAG: hypothetical protein SPG65_00825 [Campylobacter sp.]|nr:hypothetical protein [Campylobacter sp.]
MSKDKSKKWVISAPLFYNYAGILEFLNKFRQNLSSCRLSFCSHKMFINM